MDIIKQSTAVTIVMGPMLDDTDGNTPETALTIAQADIRLSKNGGAYAQTNNAAGATHMEVGKYSVPLDTTDTATLGKLRVDIHESGALAVWREFTVVPADVYDSLVLGTDVLHADVTQCGGSAVAAGAIPNAAADAAGGLPISDAGGLDLDTKLEDMNPMMLLSTTVSAVESQTEIDLTSDLGEQYSYNDQIVVIYDISESNDPSVRRCTTYYGDPLNKIILDSAPDFTVAVGDKVKIFAANTAALPTAVEIRTEMDDNSTKLSDIETDTGEIGTAGAGLTDLGGMSTGMMAEVESEANDALVALKLDHLIAVADADDVVDNSIIAKMAASGATADWSAFVNTTESLQAIRDRGDAEWITATGFSTHNAADVKTAIEAAGSHLALILADTGTDGVVVAAGSKTGYALSTAGVDAILDENIEGSHSLREMMRLFAAMLVGKVSGGGTATITFRDIDDTKDRIEMTVTGVGNRTAIVLTES